MPLYTPDWGTLVDALERVVAATGASKLEAQTAICHTIADKKIRFRVVVDPSHIPDGGRTFVGGNVGVPPRLDPADFDWTHSRPFKQWSIGPVPGQHYTWIGGWQDRPISLIELSTADVRDVLCNSATISGYMHAQPIRTKPDPDRRSWSGSSTKCGVIFGKVDAPSWSYTICARRN